MWEYEFCMTEGKEKTPTADLKLTRRKLPGEGGGIKGQARLKEGGWILFQI